MLSQSCVQQWVCGNPMTDSRDGKVYSTVQIGSQCWMAQNLNVGTIIPMNDYSSPATIYTGTSCSSIRKFCSDNDEANCTAYGASYSLGQAMCGAYDCNGTGAPPNDKCANPIQGICPTGWHIPSLFEYTTLKRSVCTSSTCATDFPYTIDRWWLVDGWALGKAGWYGTNEGDKLKKAGFCQGRSPCGTSGFNAILFFGSAGYEYGEYWTSSLESINMWGDRAAWEITLFRDRSTIRDDAISGYSDKTAIRCIKD